MVARAYQLAMPCWRFSPAVPVRAARHMVGGAVCRRKARETKQYAKQVQAEKQKERVRSKKDQIAEITKLRKQRASTGFQGDLEFDKNMKATQRMTPDKAGQRIRQGARSFRCRSAACEPPAARCA